MEGLILSFDFPKEKNDGCNWRDRKEPEDNHILVLNKAEENIVKQVGSNKVAKPSTEPVATTSGKVLEEETKGGAQEGRYYVADPEHPVHPVTLPNVSWVDQDPKDRQ